MDDPVIVAGLDEGKDGAPDEYVVEAIIDKKFINGKDYYLIKWQGWPLEESTWEPEENCAKCDNLIKEYEIKLRRQREFDSSVRRKKSDDSSSSSGPEVVSDYESRRRPRGQRKKGRNKKFTRSKREFVATDDDDDSDSDRPKKSKRRKIKKGNHESGYLSTDYLNGESTTTVDSDSSSSKSKKFKESKEEIVISPKVKKSRVVKENETIKQYLGSGGGGGSGAQRIRSRDVINEDTRTKKIISSISAKESESKPPTVQTNSIKGEVVQQRPTKKPPLNQLPNESVIQQQADQSIYQTVIETFDNELQIQSKQETKDQLLIQRKTDLDDITLADESNDQMEPSSDCNKRRRRISSTESSEAENYEGKYFGWERGKKIVEIMDWYGYKDKVLHHVKYQDGEHEYVDDSYTCINYPYMVYEMYNQYINNNDLNEDLRVWISYAVQRFQQFGQSGSHDEDGSQNGFGEISVLPETSTDKQNCLKSEDEDSSGRSESSSEDNQNQSNENSDEGNFQVNCEEAREDESEEEEEEEVENDENNQNTHNFDTSFLSGNSTRGMVNRNTYEELGNSVLVVNSTDESISQSDSVFIVQSDSSYSQMIPTNQPIVPAEFVVEESDLEDNLLDLSETVQEALYGPILNGDDCSSDDHLKINEIDPSSDLPLFEPSPPPDCIAPQPNLELFDPSLPSPPFNFEFHNHAPPIDQPVEPSNNPDSLPSYEAPDFDGTDEGGPTEEDLQFDVSPPNSP